MSLFGDFGHHLQISVGDYIPNSWVMFNWDIYQQGKQETQEGRQLCEEDEKRRSSKLEIKSMSGRLFLVWWTNTQVWNPQDFFFGNLQMFEDVHMSCQLIVIWDHVFCLISCVFRPTTVATLVQSFFLGISNSNCLNPSGFSRRPGAEVLVLYEIVWWW